MIKSLLPSKTKSSHQLNKTQVNDAADSVTDPNQIVNIFNQYFCNIEDTLAAKVPKEENDITYTNYFNKATPSSLFFTPIQLTETLNVIYSLNKSHTNEHDNISSLFLKIAAEVLAFPLTVLFNYVSLFGVFPDSLKITKVVPIHKGNSKSSVSNYRPISILPTISKVCEKLIYRGGQYRGTFVPRYCTAVLF